MDSWQERQDLIRGAFLDMSKNPPQKAVFVSDSIMVAAIQKGGENMPIQSKIRFCVIAKATYRGKVYDHIGYNNRRKEKLMLMSGNTIIEVKSEEVTKWRRIANT